MSIKPGPIRLRVTDLHESVDDPALTSMTLLNELAGRYPDAVSFSAGRPFEGFYDVEDLSRHLMTFKSYLEDEKGLPAEQVRRTFFQYGRTKGFIHELIARQLEVDEGLIVDPESIVVTTGCQEAMVLLLRALVRDARDVILAATPNYVGFIGAARVAGAPLRSVREHEGGIDLEDLERQIAAARREGLRPRACYVVPDFANPSGASMSLVDRIALLELAEREQILVIEDNPYTLFRAGGPQLPMLKTLDEQHQVIHLGSFAKSAFAGARVGYVIADQPVTPDGASGAGPLLLADHLAKLKSMVTLNTSSVAQAVIGGYLLENGCSLKRATAREAAVYRQNLATVLDSLKSVFGTLPGLSQDVSWNTPQGGMFVVVTLPFTADDAMLEYSASKFGVLWTPMHHFYEGTAGFRQARLSFSVLTPEQITLGVGRLGALVQDQRARHLVGVAHS
ncbi:aminotransferase-like domain-containing protein [Streptomyces beijiangensis]|uniref:PLP-dependent aminotransferase family protein n=1 Tax=Streptomyces beijiangensis TaxID=163361 RepID=A0A939JHE1_9ACTN|nr:PLP-dependent aminotransferase family protein [Streptomyces beijiangensis]MBO0512045.1 PLP-dependent aminotransferase family protein [Streptomyces beijiangensis]